MGLGLFNPLNFQISLVHSHGKVTGAAFCNSSLIEVFRKLQNQNGSVFKVT